MKHFLIAITTGALLIGAAPAEASLKAYMRLTAQTQGEIEGSVTQAGREDSIEVIGWSHEVASPRDAASGLPTGKRQHKPLTITKPIDKATPILFNVLTNNENITELRLEMWRPSRTGREVQYYTIELINAKIVDIVQHSGEAPSDPDMETISFSYQKIIKTWEDGGITGEDDWATSTRLTRPILQR